jgi:hypothetical protein
VASCDGILSDVLISLYPILETPLKLFLSIFVLFLCQYRADPGMKNKPIKVIINSSFAIGHTEAFVSKFNKKDDIIMELEPGTTVYDLLLRLPFIGAPENWSDLFLHVFINHKMAGFDKVLEDNDIIDLHIPLSGG